MNQLNLVLKRILGDSMFKLEDKISDPKSDDIGLILDQILAISTYTKIKKQLHHTLIRLLEKKGYVSFVGHPSKYHLSVVGDSCLYKVPLNRRGHLKIFRGKAVRIVCVRSGRYDRLLMAGDVSNKS